MAWIRCFLYRWLWGDRVRIASQEGQWLRLQIGQGVIINDMLLMVVSRQAISRASSAVESGAVGVRYELKNLVAESSEEYTVSVPILILNDIGITQCEANLSLFFVDCFCENA